MASEVCGTLYGVKNGQVMELVHEHYEADGMDNAAALLLALAGAQGVSIAEYESVCVELRLVLNPMAVQMYEAELLQQARSDLH